MGIISLCDDNIVELLQMIVRFTEIREQTLLDNIRLKDTPNYQPQDLNCDDFSKQINAAITEYLINNRILLRDSDTVCFGENGSFHAKPFGDNEAMTLLKHREDYLKHQAKKLSQNTTHAIVAKRLIKARISCLGTSSPSQSPRGVV